MLSECNVFLLHPFRRDSDLNESVDMWIVSTPVLSGFFYQPALEVRNVQNSLLRHLVGLQSHCGSRCQTYLIEPTSHLC